MNVVKHNKVSDPQILALPKTTLDLTTITKILEIRKISNRKDLTIYIQNPGNSQNFQQQRPPVITPNPNFNNARPPTIQPNPNYYRSNVNRKTLHLNQSVESENPEQQNQNYYASDNSYESINDGYYTDNNPYYYTTNNPEYDNTNEDYYTANSPSKNYYTKEPTSDTSPVHNQDFRSGPHSQSDSPYHHKTRDSNMTVLQTQFGEVSLDNFNPNLNFSE